MRTLAILSTALVGLAFASPAFAQSQAAPQTGLPPGAGIGAQNAAPPRASGNLATTAVGAQPAPAIQPSPMEAAPVRHRAYRHRTYHRRYHRYHHVYHKAAPAPAAQ